MKNIIKQHIVLSILLVLSIIPVHDALAETNKMHVIEILNWNALPNVTDQQMIDAIQGIVADLQTLPGFQYQNLAKSPEGKWVDVYFWATKEDARRSGELMAGKASFNHLLSLINLESITIEVLPALQQSSVINFAEK